MAIKKTELYSSLWQSCDALRGGMDASQYKDYILTLLFLKYVSDKFLNDADAMIDVPEGCTFPDIIKLKGDKEIGEKMNIILARIAKENELPWLANKDNDFNDEERLGKGKEMLDRLSKLVGIFQNLDFASNRIEGDDLLGDAYEYLMRHFATQSGKSKGQFYTPAEVSRILAKVVGINENTRQYHTVYDPTCGSGSLLLKAADEAPNGLSIYGQEKDVSTTALCRMNMILHHNADAEIAPGGHSTLADPFYKNRYGGLQSFDFAVANPPFSYKAWRTGFAPDQDEFARFEYGIPPKKNGDYAFLLHILISLNSTGKAAVILPHGVLFRGNAEADIRRNLIKQGYIKGIIGLPANLFYGTGIPACIIVIDKANAKARLDDKNGGIFMLDASRGFIKDGNKNRLRERDIHQIVDVFNKQLEIARYSRKVRFAEIEQHDYNLNIPRYIDASEPEDIHDLNAHLNGGIPNSDLDALAHYWQVFPNLRAHLFSASERDGYNQANVPAQQIKSTILAHKEFQQFAEQSMQRYQSWQDRHYQRLTDISVGDDPKALIYQLAEDLLQGFADASLLDKYAIYQILMDYWAELMQDDVYILIQEGWDAAKTLRQLVPEKNDKGKAVYPEEHDFELGTGKNKVRYKADLIPPALMIAAYFADEQADLEQLQQATENATQALESFIEEQSSAGEEDEDILDAAKNDKGKVTKALLTARIKVVKQDRNAEDELAVLQACLQHFNEEAAAKKAVKDKQKILTAKVFKHYPSLDEAAIKWLVIDQKWLASLQAGIQAEIERVTQHLAQRLQVLEERYAEPLPVLNQQVEGLSAKVDVHLKRMGVEW